MSEEEAMLEIEKIHKAKPLNIYKLEEAIETILDLYQTEKRKNSYLEKQNKDTAKLLHIALNNIKDNLISKDKAISVEELAEKLLILEDYSKATKEQVMSMIDTILDENNRLEDIEDKKVQIEYNLVYNKGYQDCKTKYLNKIKEALFNGTLNAQGWDCEDCAHCVEKQFKHLLEEEVNKN